MTHIAVLEELDGKAADWLEKVGDEQSPSAPKGRRKAISPAHFTGAQTPNARCYDSVPSPRGALDRASTDAAACPDRSN